MGLPIRYLWVAVLIGGVVVLSRYGLPIDAAVGRSVVPESDIETHHIGPWELATWKDDPNVIHLSRNGQYIVYVHDDGKQRIVEVLDRRGVIVFETTDRNGDGIYDIAGMQGSVAISTDLTFDGMPDQISAGSSSKVRIGDGWYEVEVSADGTAYVNDTHGSKRAIEEINGNFRFREIGP